MGAFRRCRRLSCYGRCQKPRRGRPRRDARPPDMAGSGHNRPLPELISTSLRCIEEVVRQSRAAGQCASSKARSTSAGILPREEML